ncbi:peptidoglycan DD-metalloendopeptidase family protein [Streptomyces sp. C11-1]|uniref:Peptidoglycan DD-metalloendopeptidase family protein n=1 Tax=Streptomyces durocortorensis TaxID=2811104 RepID=A0ABY9VX28_9ACTN|nr:peptidoglycan DD-metalloendopeptidase family protein [Streptomyces durocortorensis]WNF27487.1 peptidoglycan DD-metalloendopeptidase family protein [Streptomyces durocortorensis]
MLHRTHRRTRSRTHRRTRPGRLGRLRAVLVAGFAVLGLAGTTVAATADEGTGPTADTRAAAAAKPLFQMPFACDTRWQLNTYGSGHSPALDIVVERNTGSDAKPVLASAPGTVSAAYWDNGSGNTIQINHGNGWFTAYYHLKDSPTTYVRKGQSVQPSTRIGRIGTTGASSWSHLHYEQRYKASGDFTDERHRVPVHFDGVQYTGTNKEWPSVTSRNCSGSTPGWQDCPAGYVCFYSGANGTGSVCRSAGDQPNSTCGFRKSYYNNGNPQPGYDHVQVYFKEGGSQCIHHGWADGRGNFASGGRTIDRFHWRGEC